MCSSDLDDLIDETVEVLLDEPGVGRSHRQAPQIDGIVRVPDTLATGSFAKVRIVDAEGPDLVAEGASVAAGDREDSSRAAGESSRAR